MGLDCMYGSISELIDGLQILGEHVRVLVILGGNVFLDGIGEGDIMGAPKREKEDVCPVRKLVFSTFRVLGQLTGPWLCGC